MGNLIRRSVDQLLDDPLRSMDDLLRGFFVRPVDLEGRPRIDIDVREDDKAYTVHANMPGMKKEDIDVQIDGNLVRVSAESKTEREIKDGEKVVHSERYVGQMTRTIRLDMEVDDAAASAHYADGVLELVLPKKTKVETQKHLVIH